ncbi:MAG: hypothetical protein HPY64_07570 [Anaerolineae bacterium]|nr:hypothetical protein [Anaerolineae bacterium]
MRHHRCRALVAGLAICLLALAACAGPEPTATPTQTATLPGPEPARFTVTPVPTLSPTPTPIPPTATATLPPPTETPTSEPTLTETATATETETPLPPSPTPSETPTVTPTLTATPLPPSLTPSPLPPTETATLTPPPPSATATPSPSVTPLPPTVTPSETPTTTPTATATTTPAPPTPPPPPSPTPPAPRLDIAVGLEPMDIAAASGLLWVVHADGTVLGLSENGEPAAVLATDPGAVGLATDGARLWVAHRAGIVTQIDTSSGAVTARWTLNCTDCLLRGIAWDGNRVIVSDFASYTLVWIDVASGAITTLPAGAEGPTAIAVDDYGLLVMHQSLLEGSTVLTRHAPDGTLLASLTAEGFPTAMLSAGEDLWLALRQQDSGSLVRYDARTLTETWRVEAAPINDLILAGGRLYSADFINDTVTARNPANGDVLAVEMAADLPQALAVTPDNFLWVLSRRAGVLTRLWLGG